LVLSPTISCLAKPKPWTCIFGGYGTAMSRDHSDFFGAQARLTLATIGQSTIAAPTTKKNEANSHPTLHHTSTARLHQQMPSHLRIWYHAADPDHNNISLITTHKLEIPKGCARYPQVSILGIWNSHVEPVSLTLAKFACAFWHTLGMRHNDRCHIHTSWTHHDEMSQCSSHYFVHQLNSMTNP
jgi:hypothetical protein